MRVSQVLHLKFLMKSVLNFIQKLENINQMVKQVTDSKYLQDYEKETNREYIQAYVEAIKAKNREAVIALDDIYKGNSDISPDGNLNYFYAVRSNLGNQFLPLRKQLLNMSPEDLADVHAVDSSRILATRTDNGRIEIDYSDGMTNIIDKTGSIWKQTPKSAPKPIKISRSDKKLIKQIQAIKGLGMGNSLYTNMGRNEYHLLTQLKVLAKNTGYGDIDMSKYKTDYDVKVLSDSLSRYLNISLTPGFF